LPVPVSPKISTSTAAFGDVEDQLADLGHLRRAADQAGFEVVAVIEAAAQGFDFEHQFALFQRAADDLDQIAGRERLLHEIVGAAAHRLDGQRHVAVAGDDDHRQIGVELIDPAQQRHAVHAGQAHVGDDDAGEVGGQAALRLFGAGDGVDRDAGQLHGLFATEADIGIVLDEQDGELGFHGVAFSLAEMEVAGSGGSRMTKRAPPPGAGPASRSPPKSRRMSREMVSPRPRPSPGCLVVKKGSNRVFQRLFGKAAAAVGDGQRQPPRTPAALDGKAQAAHRLPGHGVDGIADQVDQHLLQAVLVAPGDPGIGPIFRSTATFCLRSRWSNRKQRAIDRLRHIDRRRHVAGDLRAKVLSGVMMPPICSATGRRCRDSFPPSPDRRDA
jgi:hypothetical protein